MSKFSPFVGVLLLAALSFAVTPLNTVAQSGDPKLDAKQCAALQGQIDRIVSIAESTTLTNEQKQAQLAQSVTESLAAMVSAAVKDPEVAKIAQEWTITLTQLLNAASVSPAPSGGGISADAAIGLETVKNQIKPYLAMMTLLCPSLVLPESVTR